MDKKSEKIRILLVDDHPEVLKQVSARLAYEQDFHVCAAASNTTLLAKAESCNPAIVLIDPFTKGDFNYAGIGALRAKFPHIQVIVLTAVADTSSQIELRKLGVKYVLEKGISSDRLVKMVRESVMAFK